MRLRPILTVAMSLALLAPFASSKPARADEVITKSGQVLTGKILREDATHITIDTEELGATKVALVDVARVTRVVAAPPPGVTPPTTVNPKSPTPDAPASTAPEKAVDTPDPAAVEAMDAAERMALRRSMTFKRVTAPPTAAKDTTPTPQTQPAPSTTAPDRPTENTPEEQPVSLGGSQLATAPLGAMVVVYEPPRSVSFAPGGVELGRRTVARLELAGRGVARLTVSMGGKDELWTVRLADVVRHIELKAPADRVRLLEGVNTGAWVRIQREDGTTAEGRVAQLTGQTVKLAVPQDDGIDTSVDVDLATAVQLDGLAKSSAVRHMLQELVDNDPVAVTYWPSGRAVIGRVAQVSPTSVALDTNDDRVPDVTVSFDGPVADVSRVPAKWRDIVRSISKDGAVRVRSFEDFSDARLEHVCTGVVSALTAYAICVDGKDGATVIPFDSVIKLEPISVAHASAQAPLDSQALGLPVLPGDTMDSATGLDRSQGVNAITNGTVVSHVFVSAPWSGSMAGVRIGASTEEVLAGSELHFVTDLIPKPQKRTAHATAGGAAPLTKFRELTSDSVEGVRVTVQIDEKGEVRLVELTKR